MLIAKIVSSNSHVDYVARIVDEFDAAESPSAGDYGFGDFVSIPSEGGREIVGVIYNSLLVNPEYAAYGPRLSPKPELDSFSPDYLNEQGILIAILLLGWIDDKGSAVQKVPAQVIPPGEPVFRLRRERFREFHRNGDGRLSVGYYSQLSSHAGAFAMPLVESVIEKLDTDASDDEKRQLGVLRQNLSWQRTLGSARH